ncbi:hypothetical protein HanPSC8_Chr00c257g0806971 [Helianthus annuus]|uniref:Uncharacterized protein n=1 Tax=Helianthus annuus TaxID=4232 RepID=A0A1Y3BWC0_HELAN|nr:hypothetical protein HanPSC8_Chr03g0123521 [Helianthus annuus]KAJ0959247.1 hypothetical protein HanPSC8_Chr00c257g0806971 [Helianthus annuus]
MFEGRNLRFTKDFRMCFVMNRLRTSSLRSSGCRRKCICLESLGIGFGDAERCFIRIDGGFICRMFPHLVVSCSLKQR